VNDFGELVYRLRRVQAIRRAGVGPQERTVLVERIFQTRGGEFSNAFAVINRNTVRVRS
jgi:hypothetical protein